MNSASSSATASHSTASSTAATASPSTSIHANKQAYSLAYLTAPDPSVPAMLKIATACGYDCVGLRPLPNGPGMPYQPLLDEPALLRECLAYLQDTGMQVFDLEIIRIGAEFDAKRYERFFALGQTLKAKALLVAVDDSNFVRAAAHYAALCEAALPYNLTCDLEFMPWTGIKTANDALQIIELAGKPTNAGLLVDALHFGRSATRIEDIANAPRELFHYAQVCDAMAGLNFTEAELIFTAREERLLPGDGTIDLTGMLNAIPKGTPISVEIPHHKNLAHMGMLAWAKLCLERSQALVQGTWF